jgi:hypothetical protein
MMKHEIFIDNKLMSQSCSRATYPLALLAMPGCTICPVGLTCKARRPALFGVTFYFFLILFSSHFCGKDIMSNLSDIGYRNLGV